MKKGPRKYSRIRQFTVLFLMLSSTIFAQLDSILKVISAEKNPKSKIEIFINASHYFSGKDLALVCAQKAYQHALVIDDYNLIAKAANQLSVEFYQKRKIDSTKYYQELALENYKKSGNNEGLFEVLLNKTTVLISENKLELAFEINKELIELAESLDNKDKIANAYYKMGLLFQKINDTEKAISYFNKALKLYNQTKNWKEIENCYLFLGNSNLDKSYNDLAIEYFERGLEINTKTKDNIRKSDFLVGIGNVYYSLENDEKALYYYKEALSFKVKSSSSDLIAIKNNIGAVLMQMERYKEAKPYFIEVYFSTNEVRYRADIAFNLAEIYEQLGDCESSLDYLDIYTKLNDSLNNARYSKNLSEVEAKYQNEKKEEQNVLLKERLKNKSLQIYYALAGILLLSGLLFFIFRGLRQKQRANRLLEEKNKIIEEKSLIVEEQHKDITDSIKYAERIQKAILPPDKLWQNILPQSFVFYQPKDILSGDFYWIGDTPDHTFIAAADCTGHGVPGALMSIVNYNLLNKAILEQGLIDAGEILDGVNKWLTESLHQSFQEATVRDGMDVSLCVIDKKTHRLNFAGAFNSIYIVKESEVKEMIPDKQPVGAFIEDNIKPFTSHYYQLCKEDVVYMFTDGYADQFGGDKGKKFKYKKLQHTLTTINQKPFHEQKAIVSKLINDWKGGLEQVDDMLLLGFKII